MMEGNNGIGCLENGSSSEGKPLNPRTPSFGQQFPTSDGILKPCKKSLVRHPSLVSFLFLIVFFTFHVSRWVF